ITVSSGEQEAQRILDSIKDGTTTFEDAARTYSLDTYTERGGDMGIKMVYELSTEIPDAGERERVIGTAKGEYTPIVKVPSGWAFFRVEETPYPADTGDSSLLEKIRSYMTDFERGKIEDWFIGEAQNFITLSREIGFDEALAQGNIEKRTFGPLPLNYGGDNLYYNGYNLFTALASFSVTELGTADTNENFWQEAFFTPPNTPSNPLVLGNYVVVLYPLEESSEDEETLDSIKTIYSSYWLSFITSNSLRSYFLQSDKLEDRFYEAFTTYILPLE
ncbi:MAG: peptidyl-prolyl cis-trans isomerase, partial [Treponema sp.]|nr:peptidyl-prolyl cis-trans isomerase [Treponema sp.]